MCITACVSPEKPTSDHHNRRDDLGSPDRFDVYYGMADNRIGAARLDMPDFLPSEGVADPPEATVSRVDRIA